MLRGFLYPVCLVLSLPAHVHILELLPNLKGFFKIEQDCESESNVPRPLNQIEIGKK